MSGQSSKEQELDVRPLAKSDKHPAIFATYDTLPVGGSFVLVNDHDPKHLREEFDADNPGGFEWEYLSREQGNWRIRITKVTSSSLPRVLTDTNQIAEHAAPGATGAVWKLTMRERDLDSNIIVLGPHGVIDAHAGPDLDVLIHILAGWGLLGTETGDVDLRPGALLWLPRRSHRKFTAGPDGLRYLTVHRRRQALVLDPRPTRSG